MEQEQVSNTDAVPESEIQENIFGGESEDFFSALDTSVNGGIQETEQTQSTSVEDGNTSQSPSEVQEQSDDGTLQKRYSDSSREAKRLNGELQELEPYMPILDAMREDPNLIQHVRNYFEGGGQAPETMTEQFDLPEDFVFDADDAVRTPESDSAKVLGATVDGIVKRRLNGALQSQRQENQRLAKETAFRQQHEMTDTEWKDFVNFAKSKSLELEDIYFLKNRQNRESNIADNTRQQMADQMRKAQDQPRSLATTGSTPVEQSPDDSVFDAIAGLDSDLESVFG